MAKKKAGVAVEVGAERGMLPGECATAPTAAYESFDIPEAAEAVDLHDEPTDTMEAKIEPPVESLADAIARMRNVGDADLAEAAACSYQFRGGSAHVHVKLEAEEADALRRFLLVLNRSNTRVGEGALNRHVASKADAVRVLMKMLAEETAA